MTREQQVQYFTNWIKDEGANELIKFALKKSNSQADLHLSKEDKEDRAQEFVAYILENMVKILDGKPLSSGNSLETITYYAWNRFLSSINDFARTKKGDGAKYLYKSLSNALSHTHKFITCSPEGLSNIQARGLKLVGLATTSKSSAGAHEYPQEDYHDWPAPPAALSLTTNNANKDVTLTRKWLLCFVDIYWNEFSNKYPERNYFLLKELVNYILFHNSWLAPKKESISYIEEQEDDDSSRSSGAIVAPTESPEDRLTRLKNQQVFEHICAQVFAGLKKIESCVFYYRCCDKTSQEIADYLGLTNKDQTRTIEDKVKKIIKNLISSAFPGPGFPDLSPDAQRAYMNHLYTYSKNRCLES